MICAILRCGRNDLAHWGKRLLGRTGQLKLVVAAMARKLTVAVWYLMQGRWTPVEEIDTRLRMKLGKLLSAVGPETLKQLGKVRRSYRQEVYVLLQTGRTYKTGARAASATS